MSKTMKRSTLGLLAVPVLLAAFPLLGASCVASSPVDSGDDPAVASGDDAISADDAIARAMEWVDVKLHYCQSPNHQHDYDAACSSVCNRHDNSQWNPYRSDCSGLVSWAWGLPAPGRTTLMFAPFESDITKVISGIDLQPGDAVNNSDHVMLFKHWDSKGHRATFIEEPGCSSSTPYAHEVSTSVSISGSSVYVPYNGMTFHAIRYKNLHNTPAPPPAPPEPKMHADRVGVSSWADNRLDLFARDESEELVHRYWANNAWHGWEKLGGKIGSSPAAVSWASGRIDVFAQGTNDHLMHKWWDGDWSGWEDLGGTLTSAPTAIAQEEGSLDVFARDQAEHLVHKYYRPGKGWSGWENLGGQLASTPTAASWAPGRIDVFARDKNDNVAHLYFQETPHGWSDWGAIHGPISNGPVVTSWDVGRLDLFGTDSHGALIHRWYTDGAWVADWENLGGTLDAAPTGVSWAPGRIDIFSRGGGDILVHKYFDSHGWSDWVHEGNMPH